VIFLNVCFVLVLCYTCVEEVCDGTLDLDDLELTLLNMGSYIISYEVLRDFMFHFLKGRYMELLLFYSLSQFALRINCSFTCRAHFFHVMLKMTFC